MAKMLYNIYVKKCNLVGGEVYEKIDFCIFSDNSIVFSHSIASPIYGQAEVFFDMSDAFRQALSVPLIVL